MYVFLFGAIIYSAVEVAFRGYTHWTMTLTGGAAFLLIYIANEELAGTGLLTKCAAGCAIITSLEFSVGCIVNRRFALGVWDYSNRMLNLLGQVCPAFSALWFLLCIPAVFLCAAIKVRLFSRRRG